MTTEIIEAEATTLPATLSDELQGIARRYVDARRRANESTLEAAAALAEAREKAKHGEWYAFLRATNTSEDLADRLLAIHEQAQRHPAFAETVAKGWLPMTQAALLARPSTPPEVREQVLEQAAERAAQQQPPPAKREVERAIQEARPAPPPPAPHPAPVRDVTPPPAPTPSTPLTPLPGLSPAPVATGEVIAEIPATPLTPLAPLPAAAPSLAGLQQAEALVALLEQALSLAESRRDALRRELGTPPAPLLPDEAVEVAAQTFLELPAVKAAAGFLAMRAVTPEEAA